MASISYGRMALRGFGRTVAATLTIAVCGSGPVPTAASAQTAAIEPATQLDVLSTALHLDELIEVMRAEGLAYGDTIARDLFQGAPPPEWGEAVSSIYDEGRMTFTIAAALSEALEGDDVEAMIVFMNDGPGARAATLEVSARAARLDPAVELAADEAAGLAFADEHPRIALITEYIEANDLIERNLADAMTSNYAFYMGLMDGGGLPAGVGEAEVLEDVWGQVPLIRQNLTEWYYSFLFMAFEPLEDAEIEAYTAFSRTPAGQQMNDALFQAFDTVFVDISRALGRAAAEMLITQEL